MLVCQDNRLKWLVRILHGIQVEVESFHKRGFLAQVVVVVDGRHLEGIGEGGGPGGRPVLVPEVQAE